MDDIMIQYFPPAVGLNTIKGFLEVDTQQVAARLIYSSSRFDRVTALLRQLHWMMAEKRIDFKLAVLVFKCVHGSSSPFVAEELSRPADSSARCRLCSASSSILVVRQTCLLTVDDRSFPVAA